ncbi:hypothetical protein WKV53_14725 [Luteolibacter sp. Y139]|uniref:Uncharacterized protein n=2 Tax=Luteolibacter soli TaxID=3135280 RepID=A0ABU9AXR6_9BACT
MSRKRRVWMVVLVLAALLLAGGVEIWRQRLVVEREDREAYFVTIHFLAAAAAGEGEDAPKDLEEVFNGSAGKGGGAVLMKHFPDGLVYKADGESFTLEEPRVRYVSLWKKDRLIGTDKRWPRWEGSGEYARKFAGQEVPGSGYE